MNEGHKVITINGSTLEDAREYVKNTPDFDTSTRWVVKDTTGKNIGEAVQQRVFFYDEHDQCVKARVFDYVRNSRTGYFNTAEEALSHYKASEAKAKPILQEHLNTVNLLPFDVGYHLSGDTHGIYNDHLYISITLDGYEHRLPID